MHEGWQDFHLYYNSTRSWRKQTTKPWGCTVKKYQVLERCSCTHVQKWQMQTWQNILFSCTQTVCGTYKLMCSFLLSPVTYPAHLTALRGCTVPQCTPSHDFYDEILLMEGEAAFDILLLWTIWWTFLNILMYLRTFKQAKSNNNASQRWRTFANIIVLVKLPSKRLYTVYFFRWLVNY